MGCLVDVFVRFSCVKSEASFTAFQLKDSDAVLRKWVAAMNKHPKLRTKNSTAKSMPKSGGMNWSLTLLLVMLAGSHGWLLGWYSGSQADAAESHCQLEGATVWRSTPSPHT